MRETLKYLGQSKYQPKPGFDAQGRRLFPYLPEPGLVKAVNLAITLERPLLLQGEPGCGKTLLARAIAYEFGQRYLEGKDEWPYFRWDIKSRTNAQDGRYTYDALGKLRDAQMVGIEYLEKQERQALIKRLQDPEEYINWGELGNAFRQTQHRPILLIDEIDKADIDFPNDLLAELEEPRFKVVETQRSVPDTNQPLSRPIVIITSNSERELPEAFLRRCLFFYLNFPSPERLEEIVKLHFRESRLKILIEQAIEKFLKVREKGTHRSGRKRASTSELLDWLRVLKALPEQEAIAEVDNLMEDPAQLGILLKSKADIDRLKKQTNNSPET
ncbi:MAG: AAA family ATPase [Xenococcaceae cyanobacterium]